ncbi:hypothetical protein R6Q59_009594 [Mikania micrantha]
MSKIRCFGFGFSIWGSTKALNLDLCQPFRVFCGDDFGKGLNGREDPALQLVLTNFLSTCFRVEDVAVHLIELKKFAAS